MNKYQSDYKQIPHIFELIRNQENEAAKQHLEIHPEEINLKGWMDDTPLHIASLSNNIELVRYLVEQGAEVNARRSGVYKTPLCWAESVEIAHFLLDHGATVKDDELYYATRTDKPDSVDLLLSRGAKINLSEPQYLIAKSITCLQVYLNHGIPLNRPDSHGRTLLHQLIWMDLPEVFDFAYTHGAPWGEEAAMHLLYYDAKARGRKEMVRHIEARYPQLISYQSTPLDPQNHPFEPIHCMESIPGNPHTFIALSRKANLLRYTLKGRELFLEGISSFATPASSNFTFDQNGHIVLPTGENKVLIIDPHSFRIMRIAELPGNLLSGQLTWLPKRNCFVSAYSWEIFLLDADFNLLLQIDAEDGTWLPKVNMDETLLAFHSYDQEDYFNLYRLNNDLEIQFIETFFKDRYNPSRGFVFNGNAFAVSFPKELEYYDLREGKPNKLWEIDISSYPSEYDISHLISISPDLLILAKGKVLLFVDTVQQRIMREERPELTSEINGLYADDSRETLFVSTNSELKLVSLQ